jgi:hypothetical protein
LAAALTGVLVLALAPSVFASQADSAAAPVDSSRISDPKAVQIADQVLRSLGGRERWNKLTGLRWTFQSGNRDTMRVSRRHAWNKTEGWHRMSGATRDGDEFLFLHRIHTNEGSAWVDGNPVQGDSLAKLLQRANALWTNDSYWLLMPYQLRDSGVVLKYAGTERNGDTLYDKLAVSFDRPGGAQGDHYWVSVNRATRRIEKWEYVLEGEKPPAKAWTWEGWEQHDGLWFSTVKRGVNGLEVRTTAIETVDEFPPSEFVHP